MSRSFGVVILLSLHFSDFSGRNFLVFELWTVQSLDKLKALFFTFTMFMAIKLSRVVTYSEGLPLIKSHDSLNLVSREVM